MWWVTEWRVFEYLHKFPQSLVEQKSNFFLIWGYTKLITYVEFCQNMKIRTSLVKIDN